MYVHSEHSSASEPSFFDSQELSSELRCPILFASYSICKHVSTFYTAAPLSNSMATLTGASSSHPDQIHCENEFVRDTWKIVRKKLCIVFLLANSHRCGRSNKTQDGVPSLTNKSHIKSFYVHEIGTSYVNTGPSTSLLLRPKSSNNVKTKTNRELSNRGHTTLKNK